MTNKAFSTTSKAFSAIYQCYHRTIMSTNLSFDSGCIEHAPMISIHVTTISIHVTALNGSTDLEVLPDSGADITVAGPSTLTKVQEHCNYLLPSNMTPQAVNGTSMQPLGKLPVTLQLNGKREKSKCSIAQCNSGGESTALHHGKQGAGLYEEAGGQ